MLIVCIHYSIFWSFFKIFSFNFLKTNSNKQAPQAKKFGFFTHFKGFSIHFSYNPNFGTERPVSSFRRFSSFRSVPPKTEIVPFRSSVPFLRRNGNGNGERRTERKDAEQERENTGRKSYFLLIFKFLNLASASIHYRGNKL